MVLVFTKEPLKSRHLQGSLRNRFIQQGLKTVASRSQVPSFLLGSSRNFIWVWRLRLLLRVQVRTAEHLKNEDDRTHQTFWLIKELTRI